jgi:hypothetical protein
MAVKLIFEPGNADDCKVVEDVLKQLKNIVAGPKVHVEPEVKANPLVRPEAPSIKRRRRRKNKNQNKRWTQTEIQFLRDRAGKCRSRGIATRFGRSVGSISNRAAQLGVSLKKRRPRHNGPLSPTSIPTTQH